MGNSGAVVIAFRRQENLTLVLQAPKGTGVNQAITIALKSGSVGMFRFCMLAGRMTAGTTPGIWSQGLFLQCFYILTCKKSKKLRRIQTIVRVSK